MIIKIPGLIEYELKCVSKAGHPTITFQVLWQNEETRKTNAFHPPVYQHPDPYIRIESASYPEIRGNKLFLRGKDREKDLSIAVMYLPSSDNGERLMKNLNEAMRGWANTSENKYIADKWLKAHYKPTQVQLQLL